MSGLVACSRSETRPVSIASTSYRGMPSDVASPPVEPGHASAVWRGATIELTLWGSGSCPAVPVALVVRDPSASAATSAATAPALPRMVIVRTGGFAGVMQEIDIAPDGSWVYTDKRTAKVERGRLTPAQRQQLARIAADPALAQEARGSAP